MGHTPTRALLAAVITSTAVALAIPAPSTGATTLTTPVVQTVAAPILQPSLQTHLAAVSTTTATRVLVQAGGNLIAAQDAVRGAGLRLESSLDRIGIAVAIGTPLSITRLGSAPGVTRVDWADEQVQYFSNTSHTATRAVPVQDGAYDVTGDGAGDAFDGAGFSVAIVDSGIDGTHPMFQTENGSKVRKNVKLLCSDALPILTGDYAIADACAVDATAVNDTDTPSMGGHGTHVAGIAGGLRVTDAAGRHLRGAAPGANLIGVSGGQTLSVYGGTLGMYWVLMHHADPCGDGSCPAVVSVNNSWGPAGGGSFSATAPQVLVQRQLVAEGVTVVWAAGNDGGDGSSSVVNPYSQDPTPGILSVANYDDAGSGSRDNALDSSSSRGLNGTVATYPDLSAPGAMITSACRVYLPVCGTGLDTADPDYNTISGTSMASPHIAGYVADLQQAALETTGHLLTPGAIEDLMVDTAHQFGSRTWETDLRNADSTTATSFDAGHGLVDMTAALARLTGQDLQAPTGPTCPVDGRFTDPVGDATSVLGQSTPLPSEAPLDVVESWFSSDPATNDVTFHWRVADLPATPGGTEGEGEYFDFNFSLGGGGYYLGATRTVSEGESFVLGRFETTRTSLASGLAGSFNPDTDEIQVTLPAGLVASVVAGAPTLAPGEQLGGFQIVSRRSLVLLVPDADTATAGCGYTVGAEHVVPVNTAPEITGASVTGQNKVLRAGQALTFLASATDADGDFLTYTWSFGDGATGVGALLEHAVSAGGTYTATVTVSDGTESVSRTVTYTVKGKK